MPAQRPPPPERDGVFQPPGARQSRAGTTDLSWRMNGSKLEPEPEPEPEPDEQAEEGQPDEPELAEAEAGRRADDDEELMQVWLEADADGSGTLDCTEIAVVLRKLGLNAGPQDVEDATTGIDANGNGIIEYAEFVDWYRVLSWRASAQRAEARPRTEGGPEPEPEPELELSPQESRTRAEKRGTVRYAESAYVEVSIDVASSDQGQLEGELRRIVATDKYVQARAAPPPPCTPNRSLSGGGVSAASRASRQLRFFDDLDAWIAAAPTVLTHSHGEEDLKKRLLTLARRSSWETVSFPAFDQDGSGELDLEEFARVVRQDMSVSGYKLADDALAQLFRRIDAQHTGTVDAATLKTFLLQDELRTKVRVASALTDWAAAFTEVGGHHAPEDGAAGSGRPRLDIQEFFVAVRMQEHGRRRIHTPNRHDDITVKLTDGEVLALFRAADTKSKGSICVTELERFLSGPPAHAATSGDVLERVSDAMRVAAYRTDWDELFDAYDTDGNGTLDFEGFLYATRAQLQIPAREIPDDAIELMFRQIDEDGGGEIEASEFRKFLWLDGLKRQMRHAATVRPWADVFAQIDSDGDGALGLDEFVVAVCAVEGTAASQITKAELAKLFERVDADEGGTISADELVAFVNVGRSERLTAEGQAHLDAAKQHYEESRMTRGEREAARYVRDKEVVLGARSGIKTQLDRLRTDRERRQGSGR